MHELLRDSLVLHYGRLPFLHQAVFMAVKQRRHTACNESLALMSR